VIGRIAKDFREGIDIARSSIKDGKAQQKLQELIRCCGNEERLQSAIKKFAL
jgi:anthranilate phosphoribosyltransferase